MADVQDRLQPADANTGLAVRVRKRFSNHERSFDLNVHFRAQSGFTVLFGASGAGKTTILDCVAGFTAPDDGRITIAGDDLYDASRKRSLPPWKRRVGYLLQELALFPHLTAEENVGFGLRHLSSDQRKRQSLDILKTFRIDHARNRLPSQLSGGERQRVALARTLVAGPRALLLDEPLTALDNPTKSRIIDDLREWNRAHRVPILYVTHVADEVFALGDQVIVLHQGKIIAQGLPHEVMRAPRITTVAQLSGCENVFDARVTASNEQRGTMTCRLGSENLELETPLVHAEPGSSLRVGIRAGDLLLATEAPRGLSARNVIEGTIYALERRDVIVTATVNCAGIEFLVHLTLAARDDLNLLPGTKVWIVVKTHSCHLMMS